jgi:hypothetical protein
MLLQALEVRIVEKAKSFDNSINKGWCASPFKWNGCIRIAQQKHQHRKCAKGGKTAYSE